MRPSSQFQDVRPSIHFFLESFLVTYLEKKIHELSSKISYNNFYLPLNIETHIRFQFYPQIIHRPNISNNTRPTIVYNIYIFVSHLFLSPLEFFIFRRIPVSKETFNSIDTTVGRIGKFPRANGACANDRWSFVPFTGRLPVCYVVAAV